LLIVLIAGAYWFTFRPETLPEPPAAVSPQQQDASTGTAGSADETSTAPIASLLENLFGLGIVDPTLSVPPLDGRGGNGQQAAFVEPTDEPAKSVYRYLVAASDIGFEANQSRLGLALATADQGEPDALNAMIVGMETKLVAYAALIPPGELEAHHTASVSVLNRYIELLRAARDKRDGSVQATWDSAEREAIADEAGRITQEIRDIVHNLGISLPSGVLP
jgi:hypothetical protein